MEMGNPSGTALMTAFLRGFHAVYDNGKIFDDSLAYDLLPEEAREVTKLIEKHFEETL